MGYFVLLLLLGVDFCVSLCCTFVKSMAVTERNCSFYDMQNIYIESIIRFSCCQQNKSFKEKFGKVVNNMMEHFRKVAHTCTDLVNDWVNLYLGIWFCISLYENGTFKIF